MPDESLAQAQQEVAEKPDKTCLTSDGKRIAKVRTVLLGLLSGTHKTSLAVQAVLTRNQSYQMVMQNDWEIEGIDMNTAFLQTEPTEEGKLRTSGVQELREAFQVPSDGVLRIFKAFYGSTTAPRNLWENIDKALVDELGALRIKGAKCFWL